MFAFPGNIPVPMIVFRAIFVPVDQMNVPFRGDETIASSFAESADVKIAAALVILRSAPGALLD